MQDLQAVIDALRRAGARFAYLHGSHHNGRPRPDSDPDPPARVAWEADTRTMYLDELPYIRQSAAEYLRAVADRGRR